MGVLVRQGAPRFLGVYASQGYAMKMIIGVLAAAWLLTGCASSVTHDDSPGANNRDARTGLCDDATPPPCGGVRD